MDSLLGIMGNTQEVCEPPGVPKNLQIQSVYCGFDLQIIMLQISTASEHYHMKWFLHFNVCC